MELLSNHKVAESYDFEKNDEMIDFNTLTIGSNKKVWWKCELGHSWEARIQNTVKNRREKLCPYCSNLKLLSGFNDFSTKHPELLNEWDYEKNGENNITPETTKFNSNEDVFWKCLNNHSWTASPIYRHRGFGKCVQCVSLGENFPELLEEWDYEKNTVDPFQVRYGSGEKVYWKGKDCGHSWESVLRNRVRDNQNCPYCSGQRVLKNFNDLATKRPDLAKLWSSKNTKTATEVGTSGENKVIWTDNCGHEWKSSINAMTKIVDTSCPICRSIQFTHPEIAKQFHKEKNVGIDILSLTAGSETKVWWKNNECGHEWIQSLWSRTISRKSCQVCINKQITKGVNDLPSQNPLLFKEWNFAKNSIDPYALTTGSNKKVWWICEKGHEWKAVVSDRNRGSQCPNCAASQQTSKPEKEIAEFLMENGINIVPNSRTLLQGRTELDIYIPEKKVAIEFNGLYWHSEKAGTEKNYHYDKWKQCQEKGIQLITIWEDDWRDKKELIKQMLSHKIGFSQQEKIYARKTVIKNINKKEADNFLDQNHVQGSVDGSTRLGLYTKDTDELIAVILFKKRNETEAELVRYATSKIVIGGFTKLLKHFEKTQQNIEKITTFADHTVSNGGLYENHGFINDYELKPDYSYVVKNSRVHKFNYRLKRFRNDPELKWEEGLSERELAQLNNIYRIYDCGKTKYVKILKNREFLENNETKEENETL